MITIEIRELKATLRFIKERIKVGNIKKSPAVVCLGAGPSQLVVILKLKQMGFKVIAVDRNQVAPGFNYCDERVVLSTYDSGPVVNKLKQLCKQYHLVGVINRSSGPPVITAAEINKEFGFPGVPVPAAKAIIEKNLFLEACACQGLSVPRTSIIDSANDITIDEYSFPCVIKPALSLVGKKGVSIINNTQDMEKSFLLSRDASYNGKVLIQEFVEGNDVILIGVVSKGKLFPVLLIDEINNSVGHKVEGMAMVAPSIYSGSNEEKHILDIAKSIIELFKLENTAFMLSCRCPAGYPKIIELHLDLGGDLIIDELIPKCTGGYDVLAYLINQILGKEQEILPQLNIKPTAVVYERGEGLIRERPFRIISSNSRNRLQKMIL